MLCNARKLMILEHVKVDEEQEEEEEGARSRSFRPL